MAGFGPGIGVGDPWIISTDDRAKYDAQFLQLQPVAGFITGEQAKRFFMMSGLPTPTLGQIWMMADVNADGKMDRREFAIAMFLIKRKLQGFELPPSLPVTLLDTSVTPAAPVIMGSYGAPSPMPGVGYMTSGIPVMGMTMTGASVAPSMPGVATGYGPGPMGPSSVPAASAYNFSSPSKTPYASTQSSASSASGEWIIPQQQRLKYKQVFNSHDPSHKGFLTGMEAKSILSQSGLVHTVLAQIWGLADIDVDGHLSPDEFCVAMYLIDLAKMGQPIPSALPPALIPPSYRRLRRASETSSGITVPPGAIPPGVASAPKTDSFGELLGGFGGGSVPVSASAENDAKLLEMAGGLVTFEDRRKENFEKGQAELERRRAMLREQQQREEEKRLAADKAEQEKRERIRQEQEMKKQMELEKQLEKQRAVEMEREEQRRKAMEQREAARKEMELQRQLEWERQKRDQLMAEMQREHGQVDRLRLEIGQQKLEFSTVSTKLEELGSRIDQLRHSVDDYSGSINAMRVSRDDKVANMEKYQLEFEEWNRKLSMAQQERIKLSQQMQSQNPVQDDETRRVAQNCRMKRENIDRLKSDLTSLERQATDVQHRIDGCIGELDELNSQVASMQTDNRSLEGQLGTKKSEWETRKSKTPVVDGSVAKANTPVNMAFSSKNEISGPSKEAFGNVDWFDTSKTSTKVASSIWGDEVSGIVGGGGAGNAGSNGHAEIWTTVTVPKSNAAAAGSTTSTNGWTDFGADFSAKSAVPSAAFEVGAWAPPSTATTNLTSTRHGGSRESTPAAGGAVQPANSGYRKHVAMYDFAARNFDELTLKAGDHVMVRLDRTGIEPEWLFGKIGGREGIFPEAFVQPLEEPEPAQVAIAGAVATDLFSTVGGVNVYDSLPETSSADVAVEASSQPPVTASSMKPAKSSFNAVPPSAPSPTPGQKVQSAPEGTLAQALYPWLAKKDNHLTFAKGDVILVKEQQDIWWSGELNGKVGWFPKSYVKIISENGRNDSTQPESVVSGWTAKFESPGGKQSDAGAVSHARSPSVPKSPVVTASSPSGGAPELCVAMYSYTSTVTGDLAFNQGDVITVVKAEGDWWTGTKDGVTGNFPANYVRKMDTAAKKKSRAPPAPATALPRTDLGKLKPSYETNSLTRQTVQKITAGNRKPEIATVIAQYQATGPEQLSLQPGQLIDVRKKNLSGWWEGELQARGQKRRIGWFPANYVKLLASSTCTTPEKSNALTPRPQSADPLGGRGASPVGFPEPTAVPSVEQVMALYKYQKQNHDELDFEKGSVINVLNKIDDDWWTGELNGNTGLFPSNYVTPLSAINDVSAD